MENCFQGNSILRYYIATKFCTCHDSTAVVPCAKFHGDHCTTTWMRAEWNFHRIWITMEKPFVKWAPGYVCSAEIRSQSISNNHADSTGDWRPMNQITQQLLGLLSCNSVWRSGNLGMMTSSNGNIFRDTGHQWIPLTKASDAELWCFLWSAPEQTVVQTIGVPVIWDAIAFIMTSL